MPSQQFHLPYGRSGWFDCEVEAEHLVARIDPPPGLTDVRAAVAAAIGNPLDYPPLAQAIVPGDRVTIVLDRDTPQSAEIVAALWDALQERGIRAEDVALIHPASWRGGRPVDPRTSLPEAVADAVAWSVHDPLRNDACGYLASTASGDRIYLSRTLIDADLVICVGAITFDPTLGYRGTLSSVYPGLSTADAMRRAVGEGHVELEPDNPRPLRELADEVGWLLGMAFAVQVVPAARGGVAEVLAGTSEAVLARGKERLKSHWEVDLPARAELVIATVDQDASGHGWPQVTAALETARQVVTRDGRIVLLTELADLPTEGIELIREAHTPHEALKPIREQAQADRAEALRLAQTLDRANVYLLSQLPDDLVEGLFMVPVSSAEEARRIMEGAQDCVVLGAAQHAYVRNRGMR